MNTFSSKLIEEAVNEFSRLPGIGRRTALRLVLFLLKRPAAEVEKFSETFTRLRKNVKYCTECHNISEEEICGICSDGRRDNTQICVVEDIRDVIAIENTSQYRGVYHVLGGVISPVDGIGPGDLNVESLVRKVSLNGVKEIIMALGATMEGDTTIFYLYKKLKDFDVHISAIARGVSVGDDLEYADEITLGRSIVNRIPYENPLQNMKS